MPLDPGSAALTAAAAVVAAGFAVALVVRWPHLMLWCSIPVLIWPTVPINLQTGIVGILGIGAAVRAFSGRAGGAGKPTWLYLGFAAVAALGFYVHGTPAVVSAGNARNSFIAMLVSLALIPIIAALGPPLIPTLKVFAVSGAVSAGYTLLNAQDFGGRAALEEYNPDAVALSATAVALAAIGLFVLTRKVWWLALSTVPLALFMAAQARSALVVLVLGLGLLWLLRGVSALRVLAVAGVVGLTPFLAPVLASVQRSLFTTRDPRFLEIESRFETLQLAGRLIVEHPFLGIGWRHFTDESLLRLGVVLNAHNEYARIAAEGGLITLVLMVGLLGRLITFRDATDEGVVLRALGLALATGLAFSNTITDLRVVLPLWLLVGIAWSADRTSRKKPAAAETTASEITESSHRRVTARWR